MKTVFSLMMVFLVFAIGGCRKAVEQVPAVHPDQELSLPAIVADLSKKTATFESALTSSIDAKKTTRVIVKVSFVGEAPEGDSVPVVLSFYKNQKVYQSAGAVLDLKTGTFDEVFNSPEPGTYILKFVLITPASRLEATTPIVLK